MYEPDYDENVNLLWVLQEPIGELEIDDGGANE